MLWVLLAVERSENVLAKPLQRFGLYLTLLSIERIIIEIFRINPTVWGRLSEAQVIGIALCMCGVGMIVAGQLRGARTAA
jgi:prolipoprotein diacylglyceryltransferase